MNKTGIEKELLEAKRIYLKQIRSIADRVREEYIVHYCKKNNFEFKSGMGTWFFKRMEEKGQFIEEEDIPIKILEILYIPITDDGELALYIQDYKGGE